MSGLFWIANLLELEQNHFLTLWILTPLQTKLKKNIPIINVKTKCSYIKNIETPNKPKKKMKIKQKFYKNNLTKTRKS